MIDDYAVNKLHMTKMKSNQVQYMDVEQYKQAAQAQAALAAEAQAAAAAGQTLNALGLGGNDTAPQIDPNLLNAANQVMGQ